MEKLCRLLEISRSGYYAWLTRSQSLRTQRNQALTRALVRLHEKYPALGLDSLYHMLKPEYSCSRGRVHRLMKAVGIQSVRKNAYKSTTNSRHSHPIAPNLLHRQFSFELPNQAWVGDITYIPTDEGWLYMAAVKDLCTKKVVGYAFSNRIDTQLTLAALNMAVRRERPESGLIFHSDRGVQYAAEAFRDRLAGLGIRQSMSRKGDPYDNAVAENFFSCPNVNWFTCAGMTPAVLLKRIFFPILKSFTIPCAPIPRLDGFHRALLNCGCVMPLPPDLRDFTYYCDSFRFSALFTVFFFGKGSATLYRNLQT